MLFLLRCFNDILFYFTCVGYFNPIYFGTLIPSFIWEENRNNFFFCCKCIHFFSHVCSCASLSKGYIWFFIHCFLFFLFFFLGSKLNLIIAFEVFFLLCSFLCFFFFFFFCSKRMYYYICSMLVGEFNIMLCLVKWDF